MLLLAEVLLSNMCSTVCVVVNYNTLGCMGVEVNDYVGYTTAGYVFKRGVEA